MAYGAEWIGPIAGAAITAGTSGAMQSNLVGKSSKSARHARKFTEYMANTAFQRGVADLRAAGLNPALAFAGGAGAATPMGMPTDYPAPPGMPDFGEAASSGISTARQKELAESTLDLQRQQQQTSAMEAERLHQVARQEDTKADILSEFGREQAKAQIIQMMSASQSSAAQATAAEAAAALNRYEEYLRKTKTPYSKEQQEIVRKAFREFYGDMPSRVKEVFRDYTPEEKRRMETGR